MLLILVRCALLLPQAFADHLSSSTTAGACLAGDSQPYVGERWELSDDVALAYTRSAFESIQAYIRIAPPDARMMSSMLLRYLNLAPVVLGPDINLISPEMIPFVEKLRVADAIGTIISGPRAVSFSHNRRSSSLSSRADLHIRHRKRNRGLLMR